MTTDPSAPPAVVRLRAEGSTLEDLFRSAALAASAVMVDPATVRSGGLRDRLHAQAQGRQALLAAWLDAVVHQFSTNRIVIAGVPSLALTGPDSIDRWSVEALVDGELLDPVRHAVLREPKGCLSQGLRLESDESGWRAEALLAL